jgi:hypothetical protein
MKGYIAGRGGKVPVVVTGTIAFAVCVSFVALCIDKPVGLIVKKLVKSLFYRVSDKVFQFAL